LPSRKEIQWSQLRVGALVLAAVAVLVLLILLTSSASGGIFSHKLKLRTYFDNAAGIKNGAPVTLEGVTIGSVVRIRVVPERAPTPVEITMRISGEFTKYLHTDSTTSIAQAGVLGDSYVDITSVKATGPEPAENAELRSTLAPSIQSVISSSQTTIDEVHRLMVNTNKLMDSLNSKRGTLGGLINDPAFYAKINRVTDNLEKMTHAISEGQGTLGKLVNDDTLYNRANSVVDNLQKVSADLQEGQGTAGKLLKDDTLYKNLNSAVANANLLLSDINAGKGGLGKLSKDPAFAQKLDDTVTRLDNVLTAIDEGKGTIGQLVQNRSLYDHTDQTMDQAQQLIKAIREDPKKYFVIRLKLF
jgi:phospholipid/cholesterol/gamma-HCH transport system substrate-binding protein